MQLQGNIYRLMSVLRENLKVFKDCLIKNAIPVLTAFPRPCFATSCLLLKGGDTLGDFMCQSL